MSQPTIRTKLGIPPYGVSSIRMKDGTLVKRQQGVVKEFGVRTNIWRFNNGYMRGQKDKLAYQHPATFPYNLAKDHIISWSNKGDTVLDCFMRSGTTAIACLDTDRKFVGIELDDTYFNLVNERVDKWQNNNINKN